jgi:hypothetical protein
MWPAATDSTSVNRLRLLLPEDEGARDRAAAGNAVRRWFASADVHPPALAPRAILLVRSVTARLPPPSRLEYDPAKSIAAARLLRESLSEMARAAARPALGDVAGSAQAVLFADRAELLACLAADWLRGVLAERWWWRAFFRRGFAEARVPQAFEDAPEEIPAAMARLETAGLLAAFLRRLDIAEARPMLRAVLRAYALDAVTRALAPVLDGAAVVIPEQTVPRPSEDPRRLAPPAAAPWTPVARPLESAHVQHIHQALAGVSLMLALSPSRVRQEAFAVGCREWAAGVTRPVPRSGGDARENVERAREAAPQPPRPNTHIQITSPPAPAARPQEVSPAAPAASRTVEPQPALQANPPFGRRGQTTAKSFETARPQQMPISPEPAAEPERTRAEIREARSPDKAPGETAPRIFLNSGYCGLFYLLNVALALELYADFTRPLDAGLALSPWDLLALLGRDFIGEEIADDAIWKLLADLAGRNADEPPGASFVPPDNWTIPEKWLAPLPGLVIGETSAADDPLRRWLNLLESYLRARLRLALGWDDPSRLCIQPGRIAVSATHVDVRLDLASHPIEVRLAGLDRDTGWIPAAGRAVAFHFE